MKESEINFAFFGTDNFSISVLEELKMTGLIPNIIISPTDKPKGRGLALNSPPIKSWAELNNVKVIQSDRLDSDFTNELKKEKWDIFVVASYGKIIPKIILDIPEKGTLNVHPSLLPKYRGPSPIESQILNDEQNVGVSIMLLDEKMDHGPILSQTHYDTEHNEQMKTSELTLELGRRGGALLAKTIPNWLSGKITPKEQNHNEATYTKKIAKEDGLIKLDDNPYQNYLKYLAYDIWPKTYFFLEKSGKQTRIKITDAEFTNGEFRVLSVIPEGGHEMRYEDFLRGYNQ
ncbi:MAG: methionyl-tRNA formyltransferase [Patescibacteria group bacterium]